MDAPFYVSYAALWGVVVFQTLVVIGLVKALHERPAAAEGSAAEPPETLPPAGGLAPEWTAQDVFGEPISSGDLLGRTSALLFVSPDCPSCAVTLRELDALRQKMGGNVVVVCKAPDQRCVSLAHHYDLTVPVIADGDRRLSDLFRVTVPPTAIVIDAEGRVESSGHPMTGNDLERQVVPAHNGHRDTLAVHAVAGRESEA